MFAFSFGNSEADGFIFMFATHGKAPFIVGVAAGVICQPDSHRDLFVFDENTFATQLIDENSSGGNTEIGSAFYLSMISVFLKKPLKSKTVILGSMTVNGNLIKTTNLYEKLEYIVEQGAKTVYVPITNQPDAITMPGEIWSKLSILFYGSADELMRKVFELE